MNSGNGADAEYLPNFASHSRQTLVYLVRHGLTDWNVQKRFQGHLEVPLSEEGIEQAQAVGVWLANQPVRFAAVYSSDLVRAMQTAQEIADSLRLEVNPAPALRELHCGEWQGLSVDEVNRLYPGKLQEWHERVEHFVLPQGESIPILQVRTHAYFKEVTRRHEGEAIVMVSHGAALSALLIAVQGLDLTGAWHARQTRMGNTGVTSLLVDSVTGNAFILAHNSTEHLAEPTGMSSVLDTAV